MCKSWNDWEYENETFGQTAIVSSVSNELFS